MYLVCCYNKKCDLIFLLIDTIGGSRATAKSKTERFVIVNGWKPLTIITMRSILDIAAALDPFWIQSSVKSLIYQNNFQMIKMEGLKLLIS